MILYFHLQITMSKLKINSPNVRYTDKYIESQYDYQTTEVSRDQDGGYVATPISTKYTFRTEREVPKLGVMLVGWGGNNGSTITASILANKLGLSWHTKDGVKHSNYFGSITQASTVCLGNGPHGEVYVPMKDMLPMVNPNDIVLDGKWSRNWWSNIYCALNLFHYCSCPKLKCFCSFANNIEIRNDILTRNWDIYKPTCHYFCGNHALKSWKLPNRFILSILQIDDAKL